MANHFPSATIAGVTLNLLRVTYQATIAGTGTIVTSGPLVFSGCQATVSGAGLQGGSWGTVFTFSVPGVFGSFDQDAAEADLVGWLQQTVQAQAWATGLTPGALATSSPGLRTWEWVSPDGTGMATRQETWNWQDGLFWEAIEWDAGFMLDSGHR